MSSTAPAPRKNNAARYLFVLLLGLAIGAIAVVMLMRAWDARRDHFHESVMYVQQWHLDQLKKNVAENRCGATDTLPHLAALRVMADDLEPAFPDLRDDKRYVDHASRMRGALDTARNSPPLNCAGVSAMVKTVGEACAACHQDFR